MFNEAFELKNVNKTFYWHKLTSYVTIYFNHVYLSPFTCLTPSPTCESTQIPIQD